METLKNYNQFKCNVTQEGGRTTNRINQKEVFFALSLPLTTYFTTDISCKSVRFVGDALCE